ncbi:2-C-methyl-D-erythritol 2,4-cyclodiphosphate synthase [Hydrogenibacillus schlegelii]|uniref:2-C-methyl-D-erythritol 2,4-cyclodiphosphate synthase n=2 Tax=Hydrogenibacillus schlegelii TaxID=1484 RepID=A0A947GAR4_HYDSH|nr:2-C-methyl-D-erythritol 2,4-cyclodiphosphate synthase [Hydrogenibacillus schlegelii]MBT9283135.1 2-C-methyl-D-erythritol 2,4-cyclodiphosphate synthase [Hydrogenibacillus schlegelii]
MMRIGFGYDVHRLAPGRPLVLGGVTIPYERGLDGHSDADVVLHALADAVYGALGEGDIGVHFPPGAAWTKDLPSREIVRAAARRAAARGYRVANCDVTVVAEAPRLGPYVPAMRRAIAEALGSLPGAVSVKATTNEGLGAIGRGEGIAAFAVVLLVAAAGRPPGGDAAAPAGEA